MFVCLQIHDAVEARRVGFLTSPVTYGKIFFSVLDRNRCRCCFLNFVVEYSGVNLYLAGSLLQVYMISILRVNKVGVRVFIQVYIRFCGR